MILIKTHKLTPVKFEEQIKVNRWQESRTRVKK